MATICWGDLGGEMVANRLAGGIGVAFGGASSFILVMMSMTCGAALREAARSSSNLAWSKSLASM
jgi:hypothetical protein